MDKQLRLLCVTRKYPPSVGGMEKFCYDLFSKFRENPEVKVEILALGKSQKNLIWFLPYCTLYLLIHARKYDVVYYGDSLLCGPAFFAKLFAPKTKHIVDVHGLDVVYPNHLYQFYLKLFYKCFYRYICNSRDTEKILHNRHIYNTIVINRGVDKNKFAHVKIDKNKICQRYGIEEDAILMITVGRLVKRKGVGWFIKNVMPAFKGQKVYYFVVGIGEEASAIREAIEAEDLGKQVYMLGKVSDSVLDALYVNSDLFIMPNIAVENDREGFGIVAIEASSAGLVVLASAIDGIVDAVLDGKTGYLLESGNADMYINKIKDYMENIHLYKEIALQFSAFTKERFGLDNVTKHYIDAFKEDI